MNKGLIGEILLPSSMDSYPALEEFTERFLDFHQEVLQKRALSIRVGTLEAIRHAVAQAPADGKLNVSRLAFYSQGQSIRQMRIKQIDPGKGFPFAGCYPPYSRNLIGQREILARIYRFELVAEVVDAFTVDLSVKLLRSPKEIQLPERVNTEDENFRRLTRMLSLILLCRSWQKVSFRMNDIGESELNLESPRPTPANMP